MYSGKNMVGNRKTKNIKMRCPLKSESTGNIEATELFQLWKRNTFSLKLLAIYLKNTFQNRLTQKVSLRDIKSDYLVWYCSSFTKKIDIILQILRKNYLPKHIRKKKCNWEIRKISSFSMLIKDESEIGIIIP